MSKVLRCTVLDCRSVDEALYREILPHLSDDRRRMASSFNSFPDRVMSAVAGLSMERLARFLDTRVVRLPNGKPVFERDDMHLSVSHSGGFVAVVWSDMPVGIDIQKVVSMGNIAGRIIAPGEDAILSDRSDRSLVGLWTMKESHVKMTGEGMSRDFGSLDVLSDASVVGSGYTFRTMVLHDDMVLSIYGRSDIELELESKVFLSVDDTIPDHSRMIR